MHSGKLLQSLTKQTQQIIHQVEQLKTYELNELTWKENPTSWSILVCLEHLNLYGNFYLPQIESKIKNSKTQYEDEFKPGFLGNYFANSMIPKEKLNKMKTFKDKNPINAKLERDVIDKFLHQQAKLLELLKQAEKVSLNKVKIETSISSVIKLKLGDTFRFFINHNIRHMKQIERILTSYNILQEA